MADLFRAFMWFYDNWHLRKNATLQWRALAAWNVLLVVAGTFLMVCGVSYLEVPVIQIMSS